MPDDPNRIRVLVADDDAISRRFFAAALQAIHCEATLVPNGESALAETQARSFDLLLLDCRMPDLGGAALLHELRRRGVDTRAIATSAQTGTGDESQLLAAGFADIIRKPLAVETLQRLVRGNLRRDEPATGAVRDPQPDLAVLDDHAALSTGGDPEIVQSLRRLFMRELQEILAGLAAGDDRLDGHAFRERLHRLRASCGFCGASALTESIQPFGQTLQDDGEVRQAARDRFVAACEKTLAALRAQL